MKNTIVLKKLLILLEEPEPSTNKKTEGHLDSGTTSQFITKACSNKTIEHKSMKVGCTNTTTMNSIVTKEINLNLPLSKKGKIASVMTKMDDNLISIA